MPSYVDNPNILQVIGYFSPILVDSWSPTVALQTPSGYPYLFKFTFQYNYLDLKNYPVTSFLQYRLRFPAENGFNNSSRYETLYLQKEPVIVEIPEASWFDLDQYEVKIEVKKEPYNWVYSRRSFVSDQLWGLKIEQFI